MDAFEKELKMSFLQEAWQMLQDTETCFLLLEKNHQDAGMLDQIFRLAHNLKGSAKAVGFSQLGEFVHEFETFLMQLKSHKVQLSETIATLLLDCNDHLKIWIKKLTNNLNEQINSEELLSRLRFEEPLEVTLDDAQLLQLVFDANASLSQQESTGAQLDETIRVSIPRLEKLMNNVGELVILQSVLNQHKQDIISPLLTKTITQLGKITKDIQDISMGLRMMALKQTFQKMQRIVRDSSAKLGKEVQLLVEGEETEIDKTVIENLSDPLVHLIRNAIDHGIEMPEEREEAGKSRRGRIYLKAYHSSGKIILQVRDDGRGLDSQLLRKKAIEKGLIKETDVLSDEEAQCLIFRAGFSTKENVSDISGRGVGMDVVKTNIEKILRGRITLTSQPGMGTLFHIELPLTLAIIEGMIVSAANEKYIVPLAHIHESLQVEPSMVRKVSGLGRVLRLRSEEMPLLKLSDLLFLKPSLVRSKNHGGMALVIRSETTTFALEVDDIIGQHQIVIKNLGQEVKNMKGVAGGAILGDGKAALILDLYELARQGESSRRTHEPARKAL